MLVFFMSGLYEMSLSQCSFSLGPDLLFCDGKFTSMVIKGPAGYTSYLWSTGETTPDITVNNPGTYSCTAGLISADLITNGNFNAGTNGFTSSYFVGTGGTFGPVSSEGTYYVTTDPNLAHSNFPTFGDHTSGNGSMLVVNGSGVANSSIWCQSITVKPNTTYNFSAWIATCVASSTAELPKLQFSINGVLLGTIFSPPFQTAQWFPFNASWNSGNNTSAAICIVNQNTALSGNDFALDDIFFQEICSYSDTIKIEKAPNPGITIANPGILTCKKTTLLLNAYSSVANVSYRWEGPGGFVSALQNPEIGTPGTYTLTVFTTNGCEKSVTITVDRDVAVPDVSAGPDQSFTCLMPTLLLNGSSSSSNVFYSWSGPGGFNSTQPQVSVSVAGLYTFSVTNASNGCVSTDSVVLSPAAPSLIVNTSKKDVDCYQGTNGNASVTVVSGGTKPYSYSWSSGETSSTLSYLKAGSYTCMITDSLGCKETAVITLSQPTEVILSPLANDTICPGGSFTVDPLANGGTPGYVYTIFDSNKNKVGLTITPAATASYTAIATDQKGCTSSEQPFSIVVLPPLSLTTSDVAPICKGNCTTVSATAKGGKGDYTYTWLPINEKNASVRVCPDVTTNYTVVVTDACGQQQKISTVIIEQLPGPKINVSDSTGCDPLCMKGWTQSVAGTSYTWFLNNKNISSAAEFKDCLPTGDYTIQLRAINSAGCEVATSKKVYVYPKPKAVFSSVSGELSVLNPLAHFRNESYGANSYLWDLGTGQQSTDENPSYLYPEKQDCYPVILKAFNQYGCSDQTTGEICIRDAFSIHFPNAFTPNDDGVNDTFKPKGHGIDRNHYRLLIYDRWGNLMFDTKNFDDSWSGKDPKDGEDYLIDSYVWTCNLKDINGGTHAFKGIVSIVK